MGFGHRSTRFWFSVMVPMAFVEVCRGGLSNRLAAMVRWSWVLVWHDGSCGFCGGLPWWVEFGLKGCHGGLSNRSAAKGYCGGFAVVAVNFRCGSSSWWQWRVAMVVGVGDCWWLISYCGCGCGVLWVSRVCVLLGGLIGNDGLGCEFAMCMFFAW